MTPCSAMLAASAASASSSIRCRGWYGFARIRSIGISIGPGVSGVALRDQRGEAAAEAWAGARVERSCGHLGSRMLAGVGSRSARAADVARALAASGRRGAELVGQRAIRLGAARSPGGRVRSAGRGSAPRTAGRCAGSRCRDTASAECRRTSAATSADRFVRPSYIVSTTPSSRGRVEVVADEIDGREQLGQSLQGVVLALDRDEHGIGGGQRVDGQQAERRRAIDEDVVVVGRGPRGRALASRRSRCSTRRQLDLGAGERDRPTGRGRRRRRAASTIESLERRRRRRRRRRWSARASIRSIPKPLVALPCGSRSMTSTRSPARAR